MDVEQLAEKIYREGIDKAKQEQQAILDGARKEAASIVESAKKEAESIVECADKETKQTRERLLAEIEAATSQAVSVLKQRIADLLSESALSPAVQGAMSDTRFIQSLILEIASRWAPSDMRLDLTVALPAERREELEAFFKTQASGFLSRGMTVDFRPRMDGGFTIGPKDGSFRISFGEKDLVQFFKSFFREKTKAMLFGDSSD
jgi:V/A-type H+-transporting ATPase subunit E